MLLNTFDFLLVLHVIFGGIGLSLGTLAMFLKKGDKQHKSIGIVYFFLRCSVLD